MLIADLRDKINIFRGHYSPPVFLKRLYLITFMFFFSTTLVFPRSFEFYGAVFDSISGEPLIGVNIFCDEMHLGTTSNDQGYFFISIKNFNENQNIYFTFQYIGYHPKKVRIGKKEKFYHVKLSSAPLTSDEISVFGSPYNSNLSFDFISPLEIQRSFTFLQPDVFRYLTSQAGINFSDDVSNRIYIRGFRSDKLLLLFDDFVLYNPYHLLNVTSSIDVGALKAVELYKAIYPVRYSGRVGGLLKLYSKVGNKNRFKASLDASLINTTIRFEGPFRKGSYFFSLRKTYIDFITHLFSDEFPYSYYDGIANIKFNLNKNQNLKISCIFNQDHYNKNKKNPSDWKNKAFGVNWKTYLSQYFYIHQNGYFSQYSSGYFPDTTKYAKNKVNDISYRIDLFIHLRKTRIKLLNLGFALNRYSLSFLTNDLIMQIFNSEQSIFLTNLYFSALLSVLSNCELEIGNGLNYLFRYNKLVLNPLIRLRFLFNKSFSLEAGFAQKSQYLFTINNEKDMFPPFNIWRMASPRIGPEMSRQLSIGIRKQGKHFSIKTELYYNNLNRIIDFNRHYLRPGDNKFIQNKGESYGTEISLNYIYKFLSMSLNYTLSRTIYTFDKNRTYYPTFNRLNKLDINVFFDWGSKWKIGFHWVYASGRPYTRALGIYTIYDYQKWDYRLPEEDYGTSHTFFGYSNPLFKTYYSEINQAHYPDYHRLDFHLEYGFSPKIKTYLDVLNLYNRKNILYYKYDIYEKKQKVTRMLPILPSLGIKINF